MKKKKIENIQENQKNEYFWICGTIIEVEKNEEYIKIIVDDHSGLAKCKISTLPTSELSQCMSQAKLQESSLELSRVISIFGRYEYRTKFFRVFACDVFSFSILRDLNDELLFWKQCV